MVTWPPSSVGLPEGKISVIELAIDTQKFRPYEVDSNLLGMQRHSDKFIVMYSGSFGQMYDFDILLETEKNIKDFTNEIHFIIRGDGEQKKHIASKIADVKLDNVTHLGPVTDTDLVISFEVRSFAQFLFEILA